jgi:hypothetical protein
MDRNLARKNITVGLMYATLCAVIFGLAFVVASIYLG